MGNYSASISKRISTRGPKIGYCVICGRYGKLSRDHVPPKKCNNLKDVEIQALLPSKDSSRVGTTSQGGTHFKTLCEDCNSKRLGLEYDPELIKLSNEITLPALTAKTKRIVIPNVIHAFIRPQRLARAIVGHTLAAIAVDEAKSGLLNSPMSDSMREYFLDSSLPMAKSLNIYYWLYPSRKQVVIKGMGKSHYGTPGTIVGHVMKFLPLGFWLVWDKPSDRVINLDRLLLDKRMGLNETAQIDINMQDIPPLNFPEMPAEWETNLLNDDYAFVGNSKK